MEAVGDVFGWLLGAPEREMNNKLLEGHEIRASSPTSSRACGWSLWDFGGGGVETGAVYARFGDPAAITQRVDAVFVAFAEHHLDDDRSSQSCMQGGVDQFDALCEADRGHHRRGLMLKPRRALAACIVYAKENCEDKVDAPEMECESPALIEIDSQPSGDVLAWSKRQMRKILGKEKVLSYRDFCQRMVSSISVNGLQPLLLLEHILPYHHASVATISKGLRQMHSRKKRSRYATSSKRYIRLVGATKKGGRWHAHSRII